MPRYKDYSYEQTKMIPISYERQILPDSFEETLIYLIDEECDLSVFEERYKNDETGAPAFDPAILLKIILYAYSRGIIHSRDIARLCEENVMFMALSADTRPHFTTIADFVSTMEDEIMPLFLDVLLLCDEMDLIGREMFAVDGCKLAANASKEWSGKKDGLKKKKKKMESSIRYLMKKHREADASDTGSGDIEREKRSIERIKSKVKKLRKFLSTHDDKRGPTGGIRQSNITDNESAKMQSSHGVVQGYNGVAAVDGKHQVINAAEAYGTGSEEALLLSMLDLIRDNFAEIDKERTHEGNDVLKEAKVVADTGYHSEQNMKKLFEQDIDAYIPDRLFRKRDPRFTGANKHHDGLHTGPKRKAKYFTPSDFTYDPESDTCTCPAGALLRREGKPVDFRGRKALRFVAQANDCRACTLREKCLRNAATPHRQMCKVLTQEQGKEKTYTEKMIAKIDTPQGRSLYSQRMSIVEPVFANIRAMKGLDRFTLRGKKKVNIQWLFYCIVHNLALTLHLYLYVGNCMNASSI